MIRWVLVVVLLVVCMGAAVAAPSLYVPGKNWAWTVKAQPQLLETSGVLVAASPLTVPTGLNGSWFWKFDGSVDDFTIDWTMALDSQGLFYAKAMKALNSVDYGFAVATQASTIVGPVCRVTGWKPSANIMAITDASTLYFGRMAGDFKDFSKGWGAGISIAVTKF